MSGKSDFSVYCLERYRYYHGLSGLEAAELFEDKGVFGYLEEFYGALHIMSDRYITEDIDRFLAESASGTQVREKMQAQLS